MKATALILAGFAGGIVAATALFWIAKRPAPPRSEPAPMVVSSVVAPLPEKPEPQPVPSSIAAPPPKTIAKRAPQAIAKQTVSPVRTDTAAPPAVEQTRPEPPAPPPVVEPKPAPESVQAEVPKPEPREIVKAPEAPAPPRSVTIISGTLLSVRLQEELSSTRNEQNDTFFATLEQPLVVDRLIIAERGARAEGRVVEVLEAGRVKGLARLVIELTHITTADGQRIALRTATFLREGSSSRKKDAARIGIGAAIGATIGAIAGGGKGAAIGAASGGAAGGAATIATRGDAAVLPAETRISFRLEQPVTIQERI